MTSASRFLIGLALTIVILAPFEQPEQALKLQPGPRGRQFPAALGGEIRDVPPRFGGLSQAVDHGGFAGRG